MKNDVSYQSLTIPVTTLSKLTTLSYQVGITSFLVDQQTDLSNVFYDKSHSPHV